MGAPTSFDSGELASLVLAEQLRTNLMADVSHELRTPLTVLESNLRAALDRVMPLDEAEIANLYNQTRHLTRLVNDLRELTLAESGHLPLEKVPTDLKALVAETIQTLEPLAMEKSVTLADEMPLLPQVTIDPFRIRQVLFNLLTNALQGRGALLDIADPSASNVSQRFYHLRLLPP